MKPNDHALEVVRTIKNKGHAQVLLSNTTEYALPIFVRLAGLSKYFDQSNAFAIPAHSRDAITTKMHVLEKYIAANQLGHHLVVIGDSPKDMALAEREHATGYFYRHPGLEMDINWPEHITPISDLRDILAEVLD